MVLEGKRVVVTGGTGSIGRTLVRRVLSGELGTPKKLICFSRDEGKQHYMRLAYQNLEVSTDEVIYENFKRVLEFRIGDIRSLPDVVATLQDADIVVHAAALKQVPICEYFPYQAIETNCLGAQNIVRAIKEYRLPIETVVGISTDKATKPMNVMGMTKSLMERIINAANVLNPETRFCCVRYGNVLASRGSVIPLFIKQIEAGGPVTITKPEMSRFLLSLEDAVDCVFEAIINAKAGDIVIPQAPSASIENLARAMIGDRNIPIEVIGIRPGEKVHEVLISEEEMYHAIKRGNYYAIKSMLPELKHDDGDTIDREGEYNSAGSVMSMDETVALLTKHGLLPDQKPHFRGMSELLR